MGRGPKKEGGGKGIRKGKGRREGRLPIDYFID